MKSRLALTVSAALVVIALVVGVQAWLDLSVLTGGAHSTGDDQPSDDGPDDDAPARGVPEAGKSFTNDAGMKMVWIPAGKFVMGRANEKDSCNGEPTPEHEVRLEGFWIGKYEVTQAEYEKLMPFNPSHSGTIDYPTLKEDRPGFIGPRKPVQNVGHSDALEFARQLTAVESHADRMPIGSRYTLPSEAQWEYAGRAGARTRYHMGDELAPEDAAFNTRVTKSVGSFAPNAFGLHDIHGNVREWCLDKWHTTYEGAPTDGSAWMDNPDRPIKDGGKMITPHIVRGGSWRGPYYNQGFGCRWFLYDHGPATSRRKVSGGGETGLRMVLTPPSMRRPRTKPGKDKRAPGEKLESSIGMTMVWVPPGKFQMGHGEVEQESPVHPVTFKRGFWVGAHEVTQAQYLKVMGTNPSHFEGETLPVDSVSWGEAVEFATKLSTIEGRRLRLPSEAEWEYAARGGSNKPIEGTYNEVAWVYLNSGKTTHPVGEKKPNDWGLYDTLGNLYEWTADRWHDDYDDAPNDGRAWMTGDEVARVYRGGSCWSHNIKNLRVSARQRFMPTGNRYIVGFRVVMEE